MSFYLFCMLRIQDSFNGSPLHDSCCLCFQAGKSSIITVLNTTTSSLCDPCRTRAKSLYNEKRINNYSYFPQWTYLNINWSIVGVLVFNTSFNNILVISWRSVLLVKKIGVLGQKHRPATSHWEILSQNVVSSTLCHERNLNSHL